MAAQGIVSGREFPLVGPQAAFSTLNLVGPLYYYLIALPYWVSTNPVVGIAFMNLLALVSIYLTYQLGTAMFGRLVGTIAAALYAVFPMAFLSERGLWNPGFIPFFSTIFLWTLWRFLVSGRPWALALVFVLLGVLLQIHLSGGIFILLLPVAFFLYRPPIRLMPLVAGLLGVFLLFAPYFLFEIQQGFADVQKLLAWGEKSSVTSYWIVASHGFSRPFMLPERFLVSLPGQSAPVMFSVVQIVELGLVGIGLVVLVIRMFTTADRRPYILLGLWYALPFVIVPLSRVGTMWYYFDILYPAPFLVIGLFAQVSLHWWRERGLWWQQRWFTYALVSILSCIIAVQVSYLRNFAEAVSQSGVLPIPPDISLDYPNPQWRWSPAWLHIPLRYKWAVMEKFRHDFGTDHVHLERRAHGSVYQLFREDKGFFLSHGFQSQPPVAIDPALHYLLLHHSPGNEIEHSQEEVFNPYRIVAYYPMIDYESWRWNVNFETGWWSAEFDDAAWSQVALPARPMANPTVYGEISYAQWPREHVAFRGMIDVPTLDRSVWLVVHIRAPYSSTHTVESLYVNGQRILPARTTHADPYHSRNVEVPAEITPALHKGSNLIAFEITGTSQSFDLDVFEVCDPRVVPQSIQME
jgi:hypothetical protein